MFEKLELWLPDPVRFGIMGRFCCEGCLFKTDEDFMIDAYLYIAGWAYNSTDKFSCQQKANRHLVQRNPARRSLAEIGFLL